MDFAQYKHTNKTNKKRVFSRILQYEKLRCTSKVL